MQCNPCNSLLFWQEDSGAKRNKPSARRVGIVGYGALGRFLVDAILADDSGLELAFVWNRSPAAIASDPRVAPYQLADLRDAPTWAPELIVEVGGMRAQFAI